MKKILLVFLLFLFLSACVSDEPGSEERVASLREAFADYFLVGNIFPGWPGMANAPLDNPATRELFLGHFNAITAENHHKPYNIAGPGNRLTRPSPEEFTFTHSDRIVDFAIENDLTLIGHVLVWHSQSPAWLNQSAPGVPLTRDEARANMEYFIRTMAEHYTARGVIDAFHSWDVVNEALASGGGTWGGALSDWNAGDWRTQMREDSPWWLAYNNNPDPAEGDDPSDYIYDAFVFARRYFPASILYYNDYNEEIPAKRNAIGQMVEQINERWAHDTINNPEAVTYGQFYTGRLLIEGIGMQSHYHLRGWTTNLSNVRAALERFVATGAVISITELDLTIGGFGSPAPEADAIPALFEEQAAAFARLFGYYLEFSDYIERVTFWGITDPQSWRSAGFPLLFNSEMTAKPAFYAILDVLNHR